MLQLRQGLGHQLRGQLAVKLIRQGAGEVQLLGTQIVVTAKVGDVNCICGF